MGAGIALTFKNKYPEMFHEYAGLCKGRLFNAGDAHIWKDPREGTLVCSLGTQIFPGRNAQLYFVSKSLTNLIQKLKTDFPLLEKEIAIPKIGCGIGGLFWDDVHHIISNLDESYTFVVYTL